MPIKILHSSDVHLESKLNFLGEKAPSHRKQLLDTFGLIVEKAISDHYDLLIIAGDLFDTPFPSAAISHQVYELLIKLRNSRIRTAIIAGNHDRMEPGSVYLGKDYLSLDTNIIHIFNERETSWEIKELDLTVVGVSLSKQKDVDSPLAKISQSSHTKYSIALLHGSLSLGEKNTNNPLDSQQLSKTKYNYIALGDWHSTKQVLTSPQTWYAGSPELINIDQSGAGNALSVVIDESLTKVEPIRVGKYQAIRLEVDITGSETIFDVITKVSQFGIKTPESVFLYLILTGIRSLRNNYTYDDIYEALSGKYYYVKVRDTSQLKLSEEELDMFPEEFLIGKFIRILQSKKGEDYSQNQIVDEAIQLGVRLLKDK